MPAPDRPDCDDAGRDRGARGVSWLLAGSAVGVYLLIVVGATTDLLDGAGSCATWPTCHGALLPDLSDPGVLAAWGHRVGTVLVGLLLLATAVAAHRYSVPRSVQAGIAVAVVLYPVQIGWAAVEQTVGIPALVLGAVIFLWTPAHFYNLALAYREDYARADIPMLPVARGEAVTRRHILGYLGATMAGALVLGTTATLGWPYAVMATLAGGGFL